MDFHVDTLCRLYPDLPHSEYISFLRQVTSFPHGRSNEWSEQILKAHKQTDGTVKGAVEYAEKEALREWHCSSEKRLEEISKLPDDMTVEELIVWIGTRTELAFDRWRDSYGSWRVATGVWTDTKGYDFICEHHDLKEALMHVRSYMETGDTSWPPRQ